MSPRPPSPEILVNIDVPDIEAAMAFYRDAFGLAAGRRFSPQAVEMTGWPTRLFLLENPAGSIGAGADRRRYERHWTPVHLDVVVDDVERALTRAVAAGATAETAIHDEPYGRTATLADPFGHGFCLIELRGRGYDALAAPDG